MLAHDGLSPSGRFDADNGMIGTDLAQYAHLLSADVVSELVAIGVAKQQDC
jgi:hypothetical protein